MTVRILGGTARSGKTTLFRSLTIPPGSVLDVDHLRSAISPEMGLDDDLDSPATMRHMTAEEWVRRVNEREDAVWRVAARYVREAAVSQDVTVVGTIRPSHVRSLVLTRHVDVRSVFLVDTALGDRIHVYAADTDAQNWQRGWSTNDLEAWSERESARARVVLDDARAHDMNVYDVADGDQTCVLTSAAYRLGLS